MNWTTSLTKSDGDFTAMKKITLIGVVLCVVISFLLLGQKLVPAQPDREPNPDGSVQQLIAVDEILKEQGLSGLLDYVEKHPKEIFPAIHGQSYCTSQPADDCQKNLLTGIALAQAIEKYAPIAYEIDSKEANIKLRRLAVLRDALWQSAKSTKAIGNVMLADLVDRLIFWSFVNAATHNPNWNQVEANQASKNYAFVIQDWQTVGTAWATEVRGKIDVSKIPLAPCEKSQFFQGVLNLSDKYEAIAAQLGDKADVYAYLNGGSVIPASTQTALKTGNLNPFFIHLIVIYNEHSTFNSRPILLRNYPVFIQRLNKESKIPLKSVESILSFIKANPATYKKANQDLINKKLPCLEPPIYDDVYKDFAKMVGNTQKYLQRGLPKDIQVEQAFL